MFTVPGFIPLYVASVVGRLPLGAISLVLLLRTREATGSYAAGGAVAAANGLALCIANPWLGRLIDRRGQARVVAVCGTISAGALALFAALPHDVPTVLAGLVAAVAGAATPPLSSCVRTLIGERVPPAGRHRAFAIDSTLFELIYIAGPLLIVGVVGAWSLNAAVVTCALAQGTGCLAYAATTLSRTWRGAEAEAGSLAGPLRGPGIRVLVAAIALIGLGLAGVEVAVAAFAEQEGDPRAVGWLLGLWGLGSMCGGIWLARSRAPENPVRRLWLLLALLAAVQVPMIFAGSLVAMAIAITIGGVAIAPSLATALQLTSEVAPVGTVTEALTWSTSAIALGLAAGSALAGAVVEASGTTLALVLVVVYGAAAAAVVAARSSVLATA